jgi:hypothetical protein
LILVHTPNGWLSLDKDGRYLAGGDGIQYLTYIDPDEDAIQTTLWEAEDVPEMARREGDIPAPRSTIQGTA